MKKNNCLMLKIAALSLLALMNACQTSTEPRSASVNGAATPPAATTTNSSQPEAPKTVNETKPSTTAAGSLATPTEAYKIAYAARQKKDVEGLKRVLSKDILDFFEMMAEAEKKTLNDELQQLADRPQAASDDTRNEKITGDTATLEYMNEKGKWETMDFIKEGNDWKLTLAKPKPGEVEVTTKKPN